MSKEPQNIWQRLTSRARVGMGTSLNARQTQEVVTMIWNLAEDNGRLMHTSMYFDAKASALEDHYGPLPEGMLDEYLQKAQRLADEGERLDAPLEGEVEATVLEDSERME